MIIILKNVPNIKNKKKDDTDIIKRAYEIYDEALEYEQASLDEGYEADYYSNNQWETKNKMTETKIGHV